MISSSLASNESGTLVIKEGGDEDDDSEPPDVAESNESGTLVIEEGGDDDDSEPPMDSSEDSRSARSSSGMLSDIPESENYGSRSQSKAKSLLL